MGIIKQGVLGGFSGKVGTVIGSSWKGKAVMRGLTIAKSGKPTASQLQQQAKFSLMIKFLGNSRADVHFISFLFAVGR